MIRRLCSWRPTGLRHRGVVVAAVSTTWTLSSGQSFGFETSMLQENGSPGRTEAGSDVFVMVMPGHWTPPGGGYAGALNHVVIHGLDITVPLGVQRRSSGETIRVVLDDLTIVGCRELEVVLTKRKRGAGEQRRGAHGLAAALRKLVETHHELTATEISDLILREVDWFAQSAPLSDDRTLVVLKVR